MIRWLAALILAAAPALAQVPEPPGFRGEPYRAPVPATLAGAQVIGTDEAISLHDAGAIFIDPLPRKQRPEGLPEGTVWREPVHETIPGAVWLWGAGYENLSQEERRRFEDGLEKASGGDSSVPMVFFCRAECWMGWNAAKRAVLLGYTGVRWFPGGIDAWQAVRPLAPADQKPTE